MDPAGHSAQHDTPQAVLESPCARSIYLSPSAADLQRIERALDAGADPDRPDAYGVTPAYRAALKRDHAAGLALIQRYIRHGLRGAPCTGDAFAGRTPLTATAFSGNLAVWDMLCARFPEHIGAPDAIGATPMHWAACEARTEAHLTIVTQAAIEHSLNPNIRDLAGRTPLMYAVRRAGSGDRAPMRLRAIYTLVCLGADVTLTDEAGDTALHHAARLPRPVRALAMSALISLGASRQARNASGQTPEEIILGADGALAIDDARALRRAPGALPDTIIDALMSASHA